MVGVASLERIIVYRSMSRRVSLSIFRFFAAHFFLTVQLLLLLCVVFVEGVVVDGVQRYPGYVPT